jgi:hypothetical protein
MACTPRPMAPLSIESCGCANTAPILLFCSQLGSGRQQSLLRFGPFRLYLCCHSRPRHCNAIRCDVLRYAAIPQPNDIWLCYGICHHLHVQLKLLPQVAQWNLLHGHVTFLCLAYASNAASVLYQFFPHWCAVSQLLCPSSLARICYGHRYPATTRRPCPAGVTFL